MSENGENKYSDADKVRMVVRGLYALLSVYRDKKVISEELQDGIYQAIGWMDDCLMPKEGLAKTLTGLGDELAVDLIGLAMLGLETCKKEPRAPK